MFKFDLQRFSEEQPGYFAHGTKLMIDEEEVSHITEPSGPSMDREDVDVTSHSSEDAVMEFVPGLIDPGEVDIEGNFKKSTGERMLDLIYDRDLHDIAIIYPTKPETALEFKGFVNAFEVTASHEDKIEFSGGIKVSGKVTMSHDVSSGLTDLEGIEETVEDDLEFIPEFDNETYEYSVKVDKDSTWIKLTPTALDHDIYVNGNKVESGTQSGQIQLGEQGSLTGVKVKAKEEGKLAKIYEITVMRPSE